MKTRGTYVPQFPTHQGKPFVFDCKVGEVDDKCITYRVEEYFQTVRELKACCLALGHDKTTCKVVDPE